MHTRTLVALLVLSLATTALGMGSSLPAAPVLDAGLALAAQPAPADLAGALALAKEANAAQAKLLGLDLPSVAPAPAAQADLEAGVLALFTLVGAAPDAAPRAQLDALRDLPEATQAALSDLVGAYLAVETARLAAPGDAATLLQGRAALMDAALRLHEALPAGEAATAGAAVVDLSPVLAVGTCGADAYTLPYAIVVDPCGADTYLNNAGGSLVVVPGAGATLPTFDAFCGETIDVGGQHVAASVSGLLLDLGTEGDAYASGGACGVNGGGVGGALGFLVDAGGDDLFSADHLGVNGGGHAGGAGFLLNVGGDDDYTATRGLGANGGGFVAGLGLLVDALGHDDYVSAESGVNGGGFLGGAGLLLDAGGDDDYQATSGGVNGGGALGVGLLVDATGSDAWSDASGACANPAPCTSAPNELAGARLDLA